jgi:two-component system, NarL family, nitrate/nitrite response regulator NarL
MTQIQTDDPIRVLIVNDQLSVLWFLEMLVQHAERPMLVVGKATNAQEALKRCAEAEPDVILFDIDLHDEDAFESLPALVASSRARVLAITAERDSPIRERAVLLGANGVVGKEEAPENILRAIEKVAAGELWLERSSTCRIFREFAGTRAREPVPRRRRALLTRRECHIVRVVAAEPSLSLKTIAERQCISESTLRNHLSSIYDKLGVGSRLELYVYARKNPLPD